MARNRGANTSAITNKASGALKTKSESETSPLEIYLRDLILQLIIREQSTLYDLRFVDNQDPLFDKQYDTEIEIKISETEERIFNRLTSEKDKQSYKAQLQLKKKALLEKQNKDFCYLPTPSGNHSYLTFIRYHIFKNDQIQKISDFELQYYMADFFRHAESKETVDKIAKRLNKVFDTILQQIKDKNNPLIAQLKNMSSQSSLPLIFHETNAINDMIVRLQKAIDHQAQYKISQLSEKEKRKAKKVEKPRELNPAPQIVLIDNTQTQSIESLYENIPRSVETIGKKIKQWNKDYLKDPHQPPELRWHLDHYLPSFIQSIINYENPGDYKQIIGSPIEVEISLNESEKKKFNELDEAEKITFKAKNQQEILLQLNQINPDTQYIATQSGTGPHFSFVKYKYHFEKRDKKILSRDEIQTYVTKFFSQAGKNTYHIALHLITLLDSRQNNKNLLENHYDSLEALMPGGQVVNKQYKVAQYDSVKSRIKSAILLHHYFDKQSLTTDKNKKSNLAPTLPVTHKTISNNHVNELSGKLFFYSHSECSARHSRQIHAQSILIALGQLTNINDIIALLITHYAAIKSTTSHISQHLETALVGLLQVDIPVKKRNRGSSKKDDPVFLAILDAIAKNDTLFNLAFDQAHVELTHRLIELDNHETGFAKFMPTSFKLNLQKDYEGIHQDIIPKNQIIAPLLPLPSLKQTTQTR